MRKLIIYFIISFTFVSFAEQKAPVTMTENNDGIITVTGEIEPEKIGRMLPHEHIMVDFIGADKTGPHRWDSNEVVEVMLPYVNELVERDFTCMADPTPIWLGRDVRILKEISEKSGLRILTNTGIYGAFNDRFVPAYAYEETAVQLSKRFIAEFRDGIDGTDIKPGFIKTATDKGPLSEIDKKLVQAAASAHLETGLTIACHISDSNSALEVLDIVIKAGVKPRSLIIVHVYNVKDDNSFLKIAKSGVWLEYDKINAKNIDKDVKYIKKIIDAGFIDQLLLSQDVAGYKVGQKRGGGIRRYTVIADKLIPALKNEGITDEQIEKLFVKNPAKAFTVKKQN